MRTWTLPLALTVAAAAVVSGCGGSASNQASPTSSASPAPAQAAATSPVTKASTKAPASTGATSPVTAGIPTAVANVVDKRKDVAITSCASASGGWGASGTAGNPGGSPATYAITIFFRTPKATVEGYASTTVAVPAGKSMPWKVTANLTADPNTQCVLRGVA